MNDMIGAICLKLNENCKASLYLAGTYASIDWDNESTSLLGEGVVCYSYHSGSEDKQAIIIDKGLDDEYILRLVETKRYTLKIKSEDGSEIQLPKFKNEGNKFLKLDKDKDSVNFQFINYLGRSTLEFADAEFSLKFEVIPDKMDYEEDYIKLTEALADECSELLLDYAGSTSNVFRQSENEKKTLLEQFIFLRKFCYSDNLMSLFEAIKRNPDRILDQEEELKPIGTGILSKKFFQNPFSYSRGWQKVSHADGRPDSYLPQMVAMTHKFDRLDTPANRFIKFAFQKFDSICVELKEALRADGQNLQMECMEEAEAIHRSLENIFRDRFFNEIGNLDILPQNNQVLQKREGYAQIFSAYAMLELALQLDWQGKDEIYEGESKNVALLYEYWLFFELYKIVKSIKGCKPVRTDEEPFVKDGDGITLSLKEGNKSCQAFEIEELGVRVNLYYNRTFSASEFKATRYEGSYSRNFRPDYTIAVFPDSYAKKGHNGENEAIADGTVSYIHFDAKYRVTDLTSLIGSANDTGADDEIADEKVDSIVNTYKRGDLLKMHTYNDAIRRTVGSYVLYPGVYNEGKGENKFSLYDEILPGVGAFSIKPSISDQGENVLRTFIEKIIQTCAAENTRLNRMKHYTEIVLNEPSASEKIPMKPDGEPLKLGDMFVMGYIRDDSEDDYYNFLRDSGHLANGSEFLFYFYAIKGNNVYTHHKDIFKAKFFRFYKNQISVTNSYQLEPVLCEIKSNELMSKSRLVESLNELGYATSEERHHADFYYVLRVKVVDDDCRREELKTSEVDRQNGNDTFSPHSPKVLVYGERLEAEDGLKQMNFSDSID